MKARTIGKYCSTSSEVFSFFVLVYVFCGIGIYSLTKFSIF
jgi:hypothetical protein